jgi:hypothetical protein
VSLRQRDPAPLMATVDWRSMFARAGDLGRLRREDWSVEEWDAIQDLGAENQALAEAMAAFDAAVLEDGDHEVRAVFAEFWEPIVRPGGRWDLAQVMRELHDYSGLLDQVRLVYDEITRGRISKPNTLAADVLGVHEEVCHADCGEVE